MRIFISYLPTHATQAIALMELITHAKRLANNGDNLESVMGLRQVIHAGIRSGTIASITSTMALMICGGLERKGVAAPLNGPSRWVWGEHASYERRATLRHTVTGFLVHHAASIFWGIVHQSIFYRWNESDRKTRIVHGLSTATSAALVDYGVTPKRLKPGFDNHLSLPSLICVYAAFGLGLAVLHVTSRTATRSRLSMK
jgi:branched-subunit amino acid transport protein